MTAAIGLACGSGMFAVAAIATTLVILGLEVLNALIPSMGTSTVMLTFTATSKESVKNLVNQIKHDCIELCSYELKNRHTSQGNLFEANLQIKVRRGKYNERLIEYMDEFDDVNISSIE